MTGKPLRRPPRDSPTNAAARQGQAPRENATALSAEERKKTAIRRLAARLRSLEAILTADLRRRGRLPLAEAADQWYAEAGSAAATGASVANTARTVISRN